MGFYASLHAPIPCAVCRGGELNFHQLHVGSLIDLPDYELGDCIRFGSHEKRGKVQDGIAIGYPECSRCKESNGQFVSIELSGGRLVDVRWKSFAGAEHETFIAKSASPHAGRVQSSPLSFHTPWSAPSTNLSLEALRGIAANSSVEPHALQFLWSMWKEETVQVVAKYDPDARLEVSFQGLEDSVIQRKSAIALRGEAQAWAASCIGTARPRLLF